MKEMRDKIDREIQEECGIIKCTYEEMKNLPTHPLHNAEKPPTHAFYINLESNYDVFLKAGYELLINGDLYIVECVYELKDSISHKRPLNRKHFLRLKKIDDIA